jgi:TetR/AcrR family transcriptional regulator, transcriptional repressor of aconitase
MPRVSRTYLDARRNAILEAALACFARQGFHETTIQDIADEAGVSHGAIYRYFASKDQMVLAVAHRDRAARGRRFEAAAREARASRALAQALRTAAELQPGPEADLRRRMSAQVLAEGVRNPEVNEAIRDTWGDVLGRMAAIVRRGQAAGELDPDLDPDAVARLLGAIHSGLVMHQAKEPGLDLVACLDAVEALLTGRFVTQQLHPRETTDDGHLALRPASA